MKSVAAYSPAADRSLRACDHAVRWHKEGSGKEVSLALNSIMTTEASVPKSVEFRVDDELTTWQFYEGRLIVRNGRLIMPECLFYRVLEDRITVDEGTIIVVGYQYIRFTGSPRAGWGPGQRTVYHWVYIEVDCYPGEEPDIRVNNDMVLKDDVLRVYPLTRQ